MIQPHPSRLTLLIFGVLLTHSGLALAQKCYYTDQKTVAGGHTPCNISAIEHGGGTTCCANGEACLTSGLCYVIFDMSINIGACTDSSWSTSNCFQKCPSEYGNANTNTLYRCNNNQWCCSRGGNTTSCCNDPNVASFPQGVNHDARIYNGSAFAAGFALSQTSASTRSSSTSAAKATSANATATRASGDACPTTSDSRNNITCPNLANNNAQTTKVGVGLGLGLGVPLLAALAASLFLWSREKKRSRELQQQTAVAGEHFPREKSSMGYEPVSVMRAGQQGFHEVPGQIGDHGLAEMVGSDGRREMATSPMAK